MNETEDVSYNFVREISPKNYRVRRRYVLNASACIHAVLATGGWKLFVWNLTAVGSRGKRGYGEKIKINKRK